MQNSQQRSATRVVMPSRRTRAAEALPTFAQLLGVPPALRAAHVLLIDIGTDIWTAIAYACQPAEHSLMATQPRLGADVGGGGLVRWCSVGDSGRAPHSGEGLRSMAQEAPSDRCAQSGGCGQDGVLIVRSKSQTYLASRLAYL